MYMKLLLLLMLLVLTVCKDVSESERATRAAFIQRLLNKQKHLEGKLKLVGGPNKFEGNVYIYHAGRWGAVCDDSWDDAAAAVVCSRLNRTGVATFGSQYGEATEKYWMDDVVCEGDEISLSHCLFSGWGSSDCGRNEAAGVICQGTVRITQGKVGVMQERVSVRKGIVGNSQGRPGNSQGNVGIGLVTVGCRGDECSELRREYGAAIKQRGRVGGLLSDVMDVRTSVRLVGGKNTREGRVEIYHNGIWGSICPDGWTAYEAAVACRHLALGYAAQALQTDHFGSSQVILQGVKCQGNETNLFLCRLRRVEGCPGDAGYVAAIVCTEHLADLLLDVSAIESTAHLQDAPMFMLQCAMEENCLSKSAYEIQRTNENWQYETRRLLRFTAASLNVGDAEFRPYLPKHLWQWHLCHMHYHSMEVFATFDVLDSTGRRVAEGHKASFCLEDNTCLNGVEKKYSCKNYGDQGVSVNCSDVYQYNIDCQWVDVTDVAPGDYTFKVSVNPHARVAEQSYHNNVATCSLRLTETYAVVYSCKLGRP